MESKIDNSPLCLNGCGFFGSASLGNYCSVCAKKLGIINPSLTTPKPSYSGEPNVPIQAGDALSPVSSMPNSPTNGTAMSVKPPKKEDRCATCNKKLRLAQRFPCKCGDNFCREHLIPQEHNCPVDHKTIARNKIAESNPVVKSDKVKDRV